MKSQAAHFDEVATGYDRSVPAHISRHLNSRRVALAESLLASGRVLDVGCGTGQFLAALPDRYERVGVDPSPRMLTQARARELEVVLANGEKLPFADASFDLVTTFAVLHHLIDHDLVRATLGELVRVARPGGAVLVWDHNPRNPYWPLLMRRLPQDQGDEKLVPAEQIVDDLARAGARDISLRRMTFVPDFTPRRALPAMSILERLLERLPLIKSVAAHNVVIARR